MLDLLNRPHIVKARADLESYAKLGQFPNFADLGTLPESDLEGVLYSICSSYDTRGLEEARKTFAFFQRLNQGRA